MEDDQRLRCPECSGLLMLDATVWVDEAYAVPYQLFTDPIPTRRRQVTVVSCNTCEFVAEVRGGRLRCNY